MQHQMKLCKGLPGHSCLPALRAGAVSPGRHPHRLCNPLQGGNATPSMGQRENIQRSGQSKHPQSSSLGRIQSETVPLYTNPFSLQALGYNLTDSFGWSKVKRYNWGSSAYWWYWIPDQQLTQQFHVDVEKEGRKKKELCDAPQSKDLEQVISSPPINTNWSQPWSKGEPPKPRI